uniref:Type IV secretion protein Rhs n=1 Tax=Heterorhabditis bacteriophora TaxID=37862 RepID=A0A1I7X6G7_HETBA
MRIKTTEGEVWRSNNGSLLSPQNHAEWHSDRHFPKICCEILKSMKMQEERGKTDCIMPYLCGDL